MWCAAYLLCLLLAGFGGAAWAPGPRSGWERFGLAACLGAGIVGLVLIALSMLGIGPGRFEILWFCALLFLSAVGAPGKFHLGGQAPAKPRFDVPTIWTILCLAGIGYGLFVVGANALRGPTLEWDAFVIWQLKAKVLALHPLHPMPDYFRSVALSYTHLRYPLLVPMISAGMHGMTGRADDELGRAPYLLMYAGMGALIYGYVKSRRGHIPAITCTTLLMTVPALLQFAGSGTAEMALTAFFAASVVCILRWQDRRRGGDLALAAFFSICMGWTKNEGLALAMINVLIVFVLTPAPLGRRTLGVAVGFAAAIVAFCLPWFLYVHGLPRTDEDYFHRLRPGQIVANIRSLPLVVKSIFAQFVDWPNWELLWLLALALAIPHFYRRPSRAVITLWILSGLQLLAYIPPYLVTPWDLNVLLPMTSSRLVLHLAPAAALLIGLQWPRRPALIPAGG
jgi:uncharacterized membrane protein YhaH (DUF805 family)